MTDKSFWNIARPLYFKSGDEYKQWPYFDAGTCFFCNCDGRYYLVTAAHVLRNLDVEPKQLFVLPTDTSRQCVPLSNYYKVKGPPTDDNDYQDIAVYRVNEREFVKQGDPTFNSFSLDSFTVQPTELAIGAPMFFFGYPHEKRESNYSTFLYKQEKVRGKFAGAALSKHCYEMKFQGIPAISDMNGFSGSPVFVEKASGKAGPRFAGLVIRGGINNGTGTSTFVGAEVLKQLLATIPHKSST